MVVKASFALWTPELYVHAGAVHFYVSLWKMLLLVAVIVAFRRLDTPDRATEPVRHSHRRAAFLALSVSYLLSVVWPLGLAGVALPWNNPPGHINFEGRDYGTEPYEGAPDPRVDTYRCKSEQEIREGTFVAGKAREIDSVERVGHLAGVFGGPALYFAHEDVGGFLIVRPTADCWIPYPEWI